MQHDDNIMELALLGHLTHLASHINIFKDNNEGDDAYKVDFVDGISRSILKNQAIWTYDYQLLSPDRDFKGFGSFHYDDVYNEIHNLILKTISAGTQTAGHILNTILNLPYQKCIGQSLIDGLLLASARFSASQTVEDVEDKYYEILRGTCVIHKNNICIDTSKEYIDSDDFLKMYCAVIRNQLEIDPDYTSTVNIVNLVPADILIHPHTTAETLDDFLSLSRELASSIPQDLYNNDRMIMDDLLLDESQGIIAAKNTIEFEPHPAIPADGYVNFFANRTIDKLTVYMAHLDKVIMMCRTDGIDQSYYQSRKHQKMIKSACKIYVKSTVEESPAVNDDFLIDTLRKIKADGIDLNEPVSNSGNSILDMARHGLRTLGEDDLQEVIAKIELAAFNFDSDDRPEQDENDDLTRTMVI